MEGALEIEPNKANAPWCLVNAPGDIIWAIELSEKATDNFWGAVLKWYV